MKLGLYDDDALLCMRLQAILRRVARVRCLCPESATVDEFDALVIDWLMPPSWAKRRDELILEAIQQGVPFCIYSGLGVTAEELATRFPGIEITLIQKTLDHDELKQWLATLKTADPNDKQEAVA